MRTLQFMLSGFVSLAILVGCSSSQDVREEQSAPVQQPAPQIDTTAARTAPLNQSAGSSQPTIQPLMSFVVQVGAYKMPDNAERVAASARERFSRKVYTVRDKSTDTYKVMIGDFTTKDDARNFRDRIASEYPSDYKDAWVSELPQQ
jgi:cell division protein FtsN